MSLVEKHITRIQSSRETIDLDAPTDKLIAASIEAYKFIYENRAILWGNGHERVLRKLHRSLKENGITIRTRANANLDSED